MTMPNDAPQSDARTRILACSRELFSQRSFAHVSLRDIASAAGVSSALIIKHFHSKEHLFERTVDFTDSASALFSGAGRLYSCVLDDHAMVLCKSVDQ